MGMGGGGVQGQGPSIDTVDSANNKILERCQIAIKGEEQLRLPSKNKRKWEAISQGVKGGQILGRILRSRTMIAKMETDPLGKPAGGETQTKQRLSAWGPTVRSRGCINSG